MGTKSGPQPPTDSEGALAGPSRALRERAEAVSQKSAAQLSENIAALSSEATRLLLLDLRVHQIELDLQNEDLRRSQLELDAERSRYFDLYELAPVGYCSMSAKGLILKANLAATSMLGVVRVNLVGQPISRFIRSEDQDVFYRNRKLLLESGKPQTFELQMVKHDGTLFWAHLQANASPVADGPPELRFVLIDITERKHLELALTQQRHLLQSLVNNLSFGLVLYDRKRQMLVSNDNFRTILGLPAELLQQPNLRFDDVIRFNFDRGDYPEQSFEAVLRGFVDMIEARRPVSFERSQQDGSWLGIQGTPLADGGTLLTYSNITERKAAESRLVVANTELVFQNEEKGKRSAELVTANEELARRTEELHTHQIELETQNANLRHSQLELETVQARYFNLYELAPVGYLTVGKNGLILQVNLAVTTLMDAPRGKLIGQPISRFILKEYQEVFYLHNKQILESDEPKTFELRMVKRDGTLFWAHLASTFARGDDGASELRIALSDITARKQAEQAQARLSAIVESSNEAIISRTLDGTVLTWNAGAQMMFRYSAAEMVGKSINITVPSEYHSLMPKINDALLRGETVHRESQRITKDGEVFDVFGSHSPIKDASGNVVAVSVIFQDITARKAAEAAVRKLARAVDQSPASVVITNLAGNIEYVNPRFENITGYSSAEVLGANPRILKSGRTSAETYREMWRVISAGGEWRGELCNRRKDGELLWESASISGLKDERGKVTHYVAVKEDIGERKHAAETLRQARQREIEIGSSIQRTLLLGEVPKEIEGAWLAAYADASQVIDGDFYALRQYRPGCFEVLVGDVMGKGVPAALMGAGIMTTYSRVIADLLAPRTDEERALPTPAQIVNAIHQALTPQLIALSSFATLALYRFDLDAGILTYVNAGHTPGLLARGLDARPVAIQGDNLPIGVMLEENYVQFSLAVGPGDSLLVFSDGITEGRNAAGEEFGLARLYGLLEPGNMADLPPATVLHALRGEQRRFNGGGPGTDDLTALMVKLRPRRHAPRGGIADRLEPSVFTLPWNLEGLGGLRARIQECSAMLSEEEANALILGSFEAATNAIRYSRLLVGDATLTCRITHQSDAVAVELIYPSAVFTPPAEVQPDFSGQSEGGFGLYIIEQSVDSVEYASPMPGIASIRLIKRASTVAA